MLSCDYTNNTTYNFHNELCQSYENINYVGIAPKNTLSRVLQCRPSTDTWVQFFVPKIIDIPEQKPSMEGIVSVNSCVNIISQRVIKTPAVTGYTNAAGIFIPGEDISNSECTNLTGRKLIIEGVITQKIIYTSLSINQALHSATLLIPFSTFIIVEPNTPLSEEFKIYPYLEDVFVYMLSERSIFSNNTLFIKATTLC